jgi:Fe-S cluster biogenesis protein NfuA
VSGPTLDAHAAGERVEALLAELADPATAATAEELVVTLLGLYGAGLDRVMEIVTEAGSAEVLHRLASDPLVSALLVAHDLHPLTTAERVRTAIDGVGLRTQGGDVELLGITDAGTVRLGLRGCPSSRRAVVSAIEAAIATAAPEITGVEVETPPAGPGPLLQIGPRPS